MNMEVLANVAISLLGLTGITIFAFWVYPSCLIRLFRYELFRLRDDLFMYAAEGGVSFNHEAYGLVRGVINGHLRYAHTISLAEVLVVSKVYGPHLSEEQSFAHRWQIAKRDLPPETAQAMDTILERLATHIKWRILLGSLFLLPFLVMGALLIWVLMRLTSFLDDTIVIRSMDSVNTRALELEAC